MNDNSKCSENAPYREPDKRDEYDDEKDTRILIEFMQKALWIRETPRNS